MASSAPKPGWYPDPQGNGGERYWTGERWDMDAPARKRISRGKWNALIFLTVFLTCGGCIGVVMMKEPRGEQQQHSGCGSMGPTCDGTPKVDGKYRVEGSGVFDSGISPGWIATPGRRSSAVACRWERLSGPVPHELAMIIEAGRIDQINDPTYVHIAASDSYFWSEGCQPWVRVDRK